MVALPAAPRLIVWLDPPFIVYTTVVFAVPEIPIAVLVLPQRVEGPVKVAVGKGNTVKVN
jgi:hypothetical protein